MLHSLTGFLILAATLGLGIAAIVKNAVSGVHIVIGYAVLACVILQVIGGLVAKRMMNSLRWRTRRMFCIKLGHRLMGYLLVALSNANIALGLQLADSNVKNLVYG